MLYARERLCHLREMHLFYSFVSVAWIALDFIVVTRRDARCEMWLSFYVSGEELHRSVNTFWKPQKYFEVKFTLDKRVKIALGKEKKRRGWTTAKKIHLPCCFKAKNASQFSADPQCLKVAHICLISKWSVFQKISCWTITFSKRLAA